MNCPNCHHSSPPGAKFCMECGSPLRSQCPQCKIVVDPKAKFCHDCGTRIGPASPSSPTPVSAPIQAPALAPVLAPNVGPAVSPAPRPRPQPIKKIENRILAETQTLAQQLAQDATQKGDASQAERRQLTVIFSDLVSFTTLSQQLDPEDLNTVVHEYYAVCRAVCERYEGHVANYLGDGVLMLFGYPKAHEDDAHRAVRTGLAIIEGMHALSDRLEREMNLRLQVRVGIHTGLMIVGDDRAGKWQQMALGETLNIAARVQAVAREGTVVVSRVTHGMVDGFFACRSIGTHQLKGVAEPMEVFSVSAESTARGRLEAAGRATLTPLTGRDYEVADLLNHWEQASKGHGSVILIRGEGGMGKSRLVQMLKEQVASLPNAWLTPCQCSPYHQNTSMYPFIDLIERVVLKLDRTDTARERLKKLEGMLVQYGFDPKESLAVFANFHSLPPEAGYQPTALDPAAQRRHYMDAMRRILDERSMKQPLLYIVEDLHWIDPSTLETLKELVNHLGEHKLLAIFTARPQFQSPWDDDARVTTVDLPKLDAAQIRIISQRVARGKRLPEEILKQIIERADGVPLFAEELTKMVIGSGMVQEKGDAYILTGPITALAIPTTLQDSLMARLDRLNTVKEIAQIAAVIGREFSYDLVRYVYPLEDTFLRHSLTQLLDEEIIDQPSDNAEASYHFKHMLVQEAAYQSLVKPRRQHYHRLIAHALEEHFPEVAESEPEVLAHHYTQANLGWQAIPYLQKAGVKATSRSSHKEAISHYTSALEQVRHLADSTQRWQMEIQLLIGMGASLTATLGYGAMEVERTYSRARDLCEQFGSAGQLFQARYGLWRLHMLRAEYEIATRQGEELLELATRQQSEAFLIASHRALGATLFYRGQFEKSLQHVRSVIETTEAHGDDDTLIRDIFDVVDPRVTCHSYLSWNLWMLGEDDAAIAESKRAIALAERLKHPFSLALALSFATWLKQFGGKIERVQDYTERSIEHCKQHGFPFWIGWNQLLLGWAKSHQATTSTECVASMHQGLAHWKEKGSNLGCGYFFCLVADVHIRFGEWSAALDALGQAEAFMQQTGEHYFKSEYHRLHGLVMEKLHPTSTAAQRSYQLAYQVAKEQGARSHQLHAAIPLAAMLHRSGKTTEAADLLKTSLQDWNPRASSSIFTQAQDLLNRIEQPSNFST